MDKPTSKKTNYMYAVILAFSLICIVSLVVFKIMSMFENITSSFLMLESVYLLLLISNKGNYSKASSNDNKGMSWLLAVVFVGNLFYVMVIAFSLGRIFF